MPVSFARGQEGGPLTATLLEGSDSGRDLISQAYHHGIAAAMAPSFQTEPSGTGFISNLSAELTSNILKQAR